MRQPAVDDGRKEVLADGQASGELLQGLFVVELLQQGDADVVVVDQASVGRWALGSRLRVRGPEGTGPPQRLTADRSQGQDKHQEQVQAPLCRAALGLNHAGSS